MKKLKPPSPEAAQYLKDYLVARATEGGKAVKKKYGSAHFRKIRMAPRARRFAACGKPRPKDPSKKHRFSAKTGLCHGCGLSREQARTK